MKDYLKKLSLLLAALMLPLLFACPVGAEENDNSGTSAINNVAQKVMPPLFDYYARIKARRAEIQKLNRSYNFKEAEKQANQLLSEMKQFRMSVKDKNVLSADIMRSELKLAYEKQGEYQKASSAVRQAAALNKQKSDAPALLKLQTKVKQQEQFYSIVKAHETDIVALHKSKQPLLKAKLALIKEYSNSSKKLTSKDLAALQRKLKKINASLKSINAKITSTNQAFSKASDVYRKKYDVVLSAQQNQAFRAVRFERWKTVMANFSLSSQATKAMTELVEKHDVSWDGLKSNFEKLAKIQKRIMDLRNRMAELAKKSPLTKADLKVAASLKNQIESLIKEASGLYEKVEDAFLDQKTFGDLSLKEKLAFIKLFANVWTTNARIENAKPSLNDLYELIVKKADEESDKEKLSADEKAKAFAMLGETPAYKITTKLKNGQVTTAFYNANGVFIGQKVSNQSTFMNKPYEKWYDKNQREIKTPNEGPIRISNNDRMYGILADIFKAFPAYKMELYFDGFIKTIYYSKDGTVIGHSIQKKGQNQPYYFDRYGRAIQDIPDQPTPKTDVSGEGVIMNLEGVQWLIRSGRNIYEPINLPARFRVNQLEVKFAGNFLIYATTKQADTSSENIDQSPNGTADSNKRIMIGIPTGNYPKISLTDISAPQLPDEPYIRDNILATPTKIMEENIENQDQPANLMNSF